MKHVVLSAWSQNCRLLGLLIHGVGVACSTNVLENGDADVACSCKACDSIMALMLGHEWRAPYVYNSKCCQAIVYAGCGSTLSQL